MNHRDLYIQTMRDFQPLVAEIQSTLFPQSGRKVAMSLKDVGELLTGDGTKSNLARGGVAALAAGAATGLTASKRSWESEEEFRRRKFRTALGYAATAGSVAGFAKPAFEKYKSLVSGVEDTLKAENDEANNQALIDRAAELGQKRKLTGLDKEKLKAVTDDSTAYLAAASEPGSVNAWAAGGAAAGGAGGFAGARAYRNSSSAWNRGNIHGKGVVSQPKAHLATNFKKDLSRGSRDYINNPGNPKNDFNVLRKDIIPGVREEIKNRAAHFRNDPTDLLREDRLKRSREALSGFKSEKSGIARDYVKYHGSTARSAAFLGGGTVAGALAGALGGAATRAGLNRFSNVATDAAIQDLLDRAAANRAGK